MNRLTAFSALAAATFLAACGGGGSDNSGATPAPVPATTAEGFWTGKASTGYNINLVVLENGETWGLYSNNNAIHGAVHGYTTSSNGLLSGSGIDFNFVDNSSSPGTYNGAYAAKNAVSVSLSSGTSFTGTYSTAYDQSASLSAIAGTYYGSASSLGRNGSQGAGTVAVISSLGTVAIPTYMNCNAGGSIAPRANGKNIFDVRLTFAGTNCALGNGSTVSGVAYYQSGSGQLVVMGVMPTDRYSALFFLGNKQ